MTMAPPIRSAGPPHARSPIPPPTVRPCRHTAAMDDVAYMVRGRTQAICKRELDRLCRLLGAEATMQPKDIAGPGWIGRAVLRPLPGEETDGAGATPRS